MIMDAVVLEEKGLIRIRDIKIEEELGPDDVRIAIKAVGVCGSDVHYYTHGAVGPYVVREPMVLGHEASGEVLEAGKNVDTLRPGDRVCMEPGIPDMKSRAARIGLYNLDPSLTFWATPPVHGCLRESVVHPAAFTYKLPPNVSFGEGALVEPFSVGLQGAKKAEISPGDVAVVTGAGTIGLMACLAALGGGCSKVVISDTLQPKLDLAATLGPVVPVNIEREDLQELVGVHTDGWGADVVFEASGNPEAIQGVFDLVRPGGCVVLIGIPLEPVPMPVITAQSKEVRIETVFRYANVYDRALSMMGSGTVNVKPFISRTYPFSRSIEAFEYAAENHPEAVKIQIIRE
jgi:D-xylulose reductase